MVTLDKVYLSAAFLQELEDHIPYMVRAGYTNEVGVDPAMALRFSGDFNGLMQELGYPAKLNYVNMRLSGLLNSTDYRGNQVMIRIVDSSYFQLFVSTWRTHRRQK